MRVWSYTYGNNLSAEAKLGYQVRVAQHSHRAHMGAWAMIKESG